MAEVDLLVGGTPCQDFSVAGLRAGMDGKRGALTIEFARLAHRLAAKSGTRWLLWENVPGVLSIDDGGAFATFLGILARRTVLVPSGGWQNSGIVAGGDGGFGLAYRVLDAQHFGVPQRRRRVFVVGYFGDWRRAAAVLFERHSLSGHPAPRREKGEIAPTTPSRGTGGGGLGTDFDCGGGLIESPEWPADIAPTLNTHFGDKMGLEDQHIRGGEVYSSTGETAHCLNAGGMGRQDFETETLLSVGGFFDSDQVAHSLRGEGFDASEDGTGRGTPLVPITCAALTRNPYADNESREDNLVPVAFSSKDHGADAGDISPTLRSMGHDGSHANGGGQVAVAYGLDEEQNAVEDGFGCLKARKEGGGFEGTVLTPAMAVRRLTPRECERLQGFPDDYTRISDKTADGPRYKALGNSMAVPVMRWIGERIQMVEELERVD